MPRPILQKCDVFDKSISKRVPGLECNKCDKIVHANNECSGLTTKQLTALRNASNLEWTYNECYENSPRRKSFVTPSDDAGDEELGDHPVKGLNNNGHAAIDVKKLLMDISKEVEKAIQKEIGSLTSSLTFCSQKIDEFEEDNKLLKRRVKDLENANTNLLNKNKHLGLRIMAIEQRVNESEQAKLSKSVEIMGLPHQATENLNKIIKDLAIKLKCSENNVQNFKRISANSKSVLVDLSKDTECAKWIQAARECVITSKDLLPDDVQIDPVRINIKPALTSFYKGLLWYARKELNEVGYKYVWYKNARIMARKSENDQKIVYIRCEDDVKKLIH